jgi:hypothetical protein
MQARRISPAVAGVVVAAFVIGGILAIMVERAIKNDSGTLRGTETVVEAPLSTIPDAPSGPLEVIANTVQYPAGYEATTINSGPTFTFVDLGRVQLESGSEKATYATGAFFYREQDRVYTMRVLNDAQLSIVQLAPPGEQPTTEVR